MEGVKGHHPSNWFLQYWLRSKYKLDELPSDFLNSICFEITKDAPVIPCRHLLAVAATANKAGESKLIFSPPNEEVNKARRILEELDKAAAEGKGAAQLDGRMIDAASARMAENIVNINKLIESK